jgi:4'-phosphopantetheinyl transferase
VPSLSERVDSAGGAGSGARQRGGWVTVRRDGDQIDAAELWDGGVHLWLTRGRWRRVARRAITGTILSRYVGVDPGQLAFARGEHGKPELLTAGAQGPVHFSTSTAPGAFAVAVAATPVGVDLELRARRVSTDALIETVCSERERSQLAALGPSQRHAAFIWCWTGKEACAKASGIGLGAPFDRIEAGAGPAAGPLLVDGPVDGRHGPWTLYRVDALADYAVAVAVL